MGEIVQKQEIFMEMDRRDQQQIVRAALGEVVEELVYTVKGRDRLSWAGVNHVCFEMGDIKVEQWVKWELIEMIGRKFWSVTVRAVNEKYNLASLGTAEVPELMEIHVTDDNDRWVKNEDGSWRMELVPDHFCRRKALSMAQRNAKAAVIPEAAIAKWIAYFKAVKKGEEVETPFSRKFVEADVVREPPKKSNKKTPSGPQLRPGKVNLRVIEYNLFDAMSIDRDFLNIWEQADGFIIEPTEKLTEEDHYKIDGTIENLGGLWEEKGYLGRWRIPRRD